MSKSDDCRRHYRCGLTSWTLCASRSSLGNDVTSRVVTSRCQLVYLCGARIRCDEGGQPILSAGTGLVYFAPNSGADREHAGGGLASEHEHIEVTELSLDHLYAHRVCIAGMIAGLRPKSNRGAALSGSRSAPLAFALVRAADGLASMISWAALVKSISTARPRMRAFLSRGARRKLA